MGYVRRGLSGQELMARAQQGRVCRICRSRQPMLQYEINNKGNHMTVCRTCRRKKGRYNNFTEHPHAAWLRKEIGR